LIAEEDTFFGREVEHIISLKHGGSSDLENLAYACLSAIGIKEVMLVLS
jgi:5-methylcytosine-specific restriction endonuclease McrA